METWSYDWNALKNQAAAFTKHGRIIKNPYLVPISYALRHNYKWVARFFLTHVRKLQKSYNLLIIRMNPRSQRLILQKNTRFGVCFNRRQWLESLQPYLSKKLRGAAYLLFLWWFRLCVYQAHMHHWNSTPQWFYGWLHNTPRLEHSQVYHTFVSTIYRYTMHHIPVIFLGQLPH